MPQALFLTAHRVYDLPGRGWGGEDGHEPLRAFLFCKVILTKQPLRYHCFRDGSNENYTTLGTWLFSFKCHRTASANEDKGLVVKRQLDPDTWVPTLAG